MAAIGAAKKTKARLVDTSCSDCCLDQVRCSKALRNIFYLGPHPACSGVALASTHLGITHAWLRGPSGVSGKESRVAVCKANTQLLYYSSGT